MVKSTNLLKEELKQYKQPVNKINRMVKDGELFPLIKGKYETNKNVHPFALARSICSPSYISFDSALSYYGLIPEAVYSVTSATFNKRKSHSYQTYFGNYYFEDIPANIYFYGVILVRLNDNYSFHIASKEKALCDKLYKRKPISNLKEMENVLFDDLRIDEDILATFDMEEMKFYSENYKSTNVMLLYKFLRRMKNEYSVKTND